jgi:hypothetical protein
MFQQGYYPLKGLGKYQQGRLHPVQPSENLGRMGRGYQVVQPLQVQQIKHSPFKHASQITWLSKDAV